MSAAILPAVCDNASPVGQLSHLTGRADALIPNRLASMLPSDLRPPVLRQPYQSRQFYYGYQRANKKGIYQVDDKKFDDCLEEFYTMLEHEAKEVYYLDKGFDKVDANFVRIKSSYGKCGSFFSLKSQLHKHLKKSYTSLVQIPLPTSSAPAWLILIIESKVIVPAIGSGPAFWGWTYVTAAVTLAPQVLPLKSDPSGIACFDIDCGVILVNKAWLLRQLPHEKIREMSILLKVRKIETLKYESA